MNYALLNEHLRLLLHCYVTLNNLDYASIPDRANYTKIETRKQEIEEYMIKQGFTIGYSDLAGWGLFPNEAIRGA